MAHVLLGIEDELISSSYVTSWQVSKIGDSPDWLGSSPNKDPVCAVCGRHLVFVVQLYCPLSALPYHRTLYVFACTSCYNNPQSWCVLRSQKLDPSYAVEGTEEETCAGAGGDDWGVKGAEDWGVEDADDWGDGDAESMQQDVPKVEQEEVPNLVEEVLNMGVEDMPGMETKNVPDVPSIVQEQDVPNNSTNSQHNVDNNTNEFTEDESLTSELQTMSIEDNTTENNTDDSTLIAEELNINPNESVLSKLLVEPQSKEISDVSACKLIGRFISVIEEPERYVNYKYEEKLFREYTRREGVDVKLQAEETFGMKGGKGAEGYEKAVTKHGDQIFHKFSKRIAACPQQILRYCHKGEPLHISVPVQAPVPACTSCGRERLFEFQLMPAMVPLLKTQSNEEALIEFGTVLIFTCSASCWVDQGCDYRTEHVQIEADPDHAVFKGIMKP